MALGVTVGSVSTPVPEGFSIGECQVYPSDNLVCCGTASVQLEPKVMALLLHLVRNAGITLSREQLFEAVWPGVIVGDDTLTQAIAKLRKALRDDAKHPRYIHTVPKRGYRLCAPATFPPCRTPTPEAMRRYGLWGAFVAVPFLLAGVVVAFIMAAGSTAELPVTMPPAQIASDELPALTVEPFRLLGEDDSHAYLAQGLTYDLITALAKLSGLQVISSRSIMGQGVNPPVTRPTGYRIQGDVQRIGRELRVHVNLSDTRNGRQLWSERYLQPIDNVFQIQEAISRQIVATLAIKIDDAEQRRLAHRYTRSVQAYELFLRAQALLLVRQKPENEAAQGLFRQAIAMDPSFARAYGGLALSFAAAFRNQWALDGAEALRRAHAMARTALEIDPEIAEIYWVLAYVSTQQRQHQEAIDLLRKAISLDHSFADAYALMGGIKTYMGQPAETVQLVRMAIRLNPDAGYLYFLLLGRAYFFLGDGEQARINIREALERNPTNLEARIYLAAIYEAFGDTEGAAWQRGEIRALQADFAMDTWLQTYPMTDPQQRTQLLSALQRLGL